MIEGCLKDRSIPTTLTIEVLKQYFPNLDVVTTSGEYNTSRYTKGVFVKDEGNFRLLRIKGDCPNWQNGQCLLKEHCLLLSQALIKP